MDERKKIITCEKCSNLMRIPRDKHVRFFCPTCNTKYEYNNGEKIVIPNEEYSNLTATVLESNPLPRKKNYNFLRWVIGLGLIFLIGLIIWKPNQRSPHLSNIAELANSNELQKTSQSSYQGIPNYQIPEIPNYNLADSIFNELLHQLLDELKDQILDKLLEKIKEQADQGHYDKANSWYEIIVEDLTTKGAEGEKFVNRSAAKLAALNYYIARKNPNSQILPQSTLVHPLKKLGAFASVTFKNTTKYGIYLSFSGLSSKITFALPYQIKTMHLLRGNYSITLNSPGSNLRGYSSQTFIGTDYFFNIIIEYR